MKKNQGMTLVSVVIMIVILAIIATLSIITTTKTVKEAKEMQKQENLVIIQSMVNQVATKYQTSGYLTPADTKIYGKRLDDSIIATICEDEPGYYDYRLVDDEKIEDWFILEQDDLEEMGVTYIDGAYFANYATGEVYTSEEFSSKIKGTTIKTIKE